MDDLMLSTHHIMGLRWSILQAILYLSILCNFGYAGIFFWEGRAFFSSLLQ